MKPIKTVIFSILIVLESPMNNRLKYVLFFKLYEFKIYVNQLAN